MSRDGEPCFPPVLGHPNEVVLVMGTDRGKILPTPAFVASLAAQYGSPKHRDALLTQRMRQTSSIRNNEAYNKVSLDVAREEMKSKALVAAKVKKPPKTVQ